MSFPYRATSARQLRAGVVPGFTPLCTEASRAGKSLVQPCAERAFVFPFRGLCVDALIELSDENADWKLSFNEFLKCLSPSFNPPEKSRNTSLILGNQRVLGGKEAKETSFGPNIRYSNSAPRDSVDTCLLLIQQHPLSLHCPKYCFLCSRTPTALVVKKVWILEARA